MSGTSIAITVDDAEIAAGLQRLADTGADLRPALDAIGAALVFSSQRRFEAKRGPDGEAWAPFAPPTLQRMPKRRQPPQLLRDRVRLYKSIVHQLADDTVAVGTNVVYAAIHQFGGAIAMPERQGSATFRIARDGAGRTKDGRRVGSRLRFARANTRAKSRHTKAFVVPAHTVRIPARPYLGISAEDRTKILAILADKLIRAGAEGTP